MTRKINYLFTALFAVVLFVLSGCQNMGIGTIDGAGKKGPLLVTLRSNYTNDARSMYVPSNWSDTELDGLTFHLSGFSSMGDEFDKDVTFDASHKGTVELTYDIWTLTLTASDANGIVLQGSTYADLSNGGSSIKFNLTTNGLTTTGDIDLTGSYTESIPSETSCNKYIIRLLDFYSRKPIIDDEVVNNPSNTQISFNKTDIPSGLYLGEIVYYKGTGKIGYWSDLIRVVPGKTTEASGVDFGTMKSKPLPPSGLQVTNVANSDYEDGSYKVKLNWTDESTNEENFVLEVYTYDTWNGTETLLKKFDVDTKDGSVEMLSDPMYVSGGIQSSSEELVLKLKTGVIYDFKIAAKNIIGTSKFVEREASADYKAPGTESIARTMITYNLNGGTFTESNDTVFVGEFKYQFTQYKGTNIPLMTLKTDEKLELNGYPFSKWGDSYASNANQVTETDGVKDIMVFALYLTETEIEYDVETFDNILDASSVTAVDKDGTSVKGGVVNVTDKTQKITFSVTDTDFDSYQVRVGDRTIFKGEVGTNFTFNNFTTFPSGEYNVIVVAHSKDKDSWYGDQFTLTIAR